MLQAMQGGPRLLRDLAQRNGKHADPGIRQGLAELYTWGELGRMNGLRLKAAKEAGRDIPGMPNISKLSMSHIMRLSRDLGLRIAGASGMLHAYDAEGREAIVRATGEPSPAVITELALSGPGALDLRRHRPDPAQHHRRTGARAAQGAQPRPDHALLRAARRTSDPDRGAPDRRVTTELSGSDPAS